MTNHSAVFVQRTSILQERAINLYMISVFIAALETESERSLFEQWYLRYRQTMYAVAYGVLNNKEDAEDAVHQTFVNLADNYEKAAAIPEDELKAFIIVITRNTAINLYRRNKREAEQFITLESYTEPVETDFFEHSDYEMLVQTIMTLPPKYKDVLFLRYVQELSAKEVANLIGVPAETVRKRTERAKKLLKLSLERSDIIAS